MVPPGLAVLRPKDLALAGAGIFVSAACSDRTTGGQLELDCPSRVVVVAVGTAGDFLGCSKHPDVPRLTCLAGCVPDMALAVCAELALAFGLCEAGAGFLWLGGQDGFDLVLDGGAAVAGVRGCEGVAAREDGLCDAHGLGSWEGMVAGWVVGVWLGVWLGVGWCW